MNEEHVKFISYSGEYPNLCRGVLTLEIDGEKVSFGHDCYNSESWKTDGNYDSFWVSGGSTYFTGDYEVAHTEYGEWIIYEDELPEQYRKYTKEISEIFNENVWPGCCGGCL